MQDEIWKNMFLLYAYKDGQKYVLNGKNKATMLYTDSFNSVKMVLKNNLEQLWFMFTFLRLVYIDVDEKGSELKDFQKLSYISY